MSPRCKLCDRDFNSDEALRRHKEASSAHKFDCTICDRHFGSDTALEQHFRYAAVHAQYSHSNNHDQFFDREKASLRRPSNPSTYAPSFRCGNCDRSFRSGEALGQHLRDSPAHIPSFQHSTVLAMPPKNQKPIQKWSMYPSLHNNVSDLLHEDSLFFSFYEKDDDTSCLNDYDTFIMGRFTCRNRACPTVWTSKQIAITIRRYSHERYNARVYHQSCKHCRTTSEPQLDHSYAERVAYRLKKWCGVEMEALPFSGRADGPHRSDLCEGCKMGHCSKLVLGF